MNNKHLSRLFAQTLNEKQVELFDEFLHPGYNNRNPYGTFSKPFMGYQPNSTAVQMRSIDIWRVKDGKLIEHWDELNLLEVFQQIGAATVRKPVGQ